MNRWLGLTLVALILLLVGSMLSGVLILPNHSSEYSREEQSSEDSLPPVVSFMLLLSPLLAIAIFLGWCFRDNNYSALIRHLCGWYRSGYNKRNFSIVQPMSPIT
jgi:hypothetical protein